MTWLINFRMKKINRADFFSGKLEEAERKEREYKVEVR